MTHYLYRLVDERTGDFYVGVRTCHVHPEDDRGYMGSGRWPSACAFYKVPLRKDVLAVLPSRCLALEAEQLLIDLALQDTRCCNSVKTASATFKATATRPCRSGIRPAPGHEWRPGVYG